MEGVGITHETYLNARLLIDFRKTSKMTTDEMGEKEYELPTIPRLKDIITRDVFLHVMESKGYITIFEDNLCILLVGKAGKVAKKFKQIIKQVMEDKNFKKVEEIIIACEKSNSSFPKILAYEFTEHPKIFIRFVDFELFGCYYPSHSVYIPHIKIGKEDLERRKTFTNHSVHTGILHYTDAACVWHGFRIGDYVSARPLTVSALEAELVFKII